jgi:diaminopimelate epimerase
MRLCQMQETGMPSQRLVIPFHKLYSCGADFVCIDNSELRLPVSFMADWARNVCRRTLGVGADGLIFLESAPTEHEAEYTWQVYAADGSPVEMCGNASSCTALLAVELNLAGAEHCFGSDAGPLRAVVDVAHSSVKVELPHPRDLALDLLLEIGQTSLALHFVNTCGPHAVVLVKDISKANVRSMGAALSSHQHFAPAGANVNFLSVLDRRRLTVRTYARDLENEAPVCSTGAAASAFVAHALGLADAKLEVNTSGGEILGVSIEEGSIFLSGRTVHSFSGQFHPGDLDLSLP